MFLDNDMLCVAMHGFMLELLVCLVPAPGSTAWKEL